MELQTTLLLSAFSFSIAKLNDLGESLNTLLFFIIDTTIMIDKKTITHILYCVQYSKDILDFIQLELQLQEHDEKSCSLGGMQKSKGKNWSL